MPLQIVPTSHAAAHAAATERKAGMLAGRFCARARGAHAMRKLPTKNKQAVFLPKHNLSPAWQRELVASVSEISDESRQVCLARDSFQTTWHREQRNVVFLMANERVFVRQYESFGVCAVVQDTNTVGVLSGS